MSGVGIVVSTVDAGLNAKSSLIAAATQGLLGLASRVPLVGHIAGVLQDLFAVYQVCAGAQGPAGRTHTLAGVGCLALEHC